jgi:hypothetical protein
VIKDPNARRPRLLFDLHRATAAHFGNPITADLHGLPSRPRPDAR